MSKSNDGGSAFPCNSPDGRDANEGMTLRDYFAGQALTGMLAGRLFLSDKNLIPREAYIFADDLIAERDKTK